ncbi:6-phosphogluconolactonase [Rhodococcus rhodnii]|uniref:6-phosphogluconolactonase n=2 Tax=Rhodococcus rhodnii TaxID=38312 RepID=R7WKJ9_9NOCA|nr:6-phosphogluconolactonase [Rhodococcus rhodnii]EOM75800.1 6-phosphogluconolactonase [Rhodococcus rhodnii LMG 5362]TXG91104.1 6-phosphogluconolactonase [Rhodococcus rhodnii]
MTVRIEVFDDLDAVAQAAGKRLVEKIAAVQAERGVCSIVLTGGSAGIAVLDHVRRSQSDVDWRHVDIYWGDERFVPEDDGDRNELQARRALLEHIDVDPDRVHPMPAAGGEFGDDAEAAARAYGELLARRGDPAPEFDVHLLGMGPDGHIESLFPGHAALDEQTAAVVAVHDSPKPPPVRITLTYPALRNVDEVWFLVTGSDKAAPAAAAIGGDADVHEVPAAGARGRSATVWFLDTAAASELPES